MKITVGSLYAGVGGIDKGMKNAGFCIEWANENNPNACITYRHNHDPKALIEQSIFDLDLSQLPSVDVLAAGFPCQPFSIAGLQEGFADKRGNHFLRIMDIVDALKPRVIFLENVKNIKTHDKGNTYKTITQEITSRGYRFKDMIINTTEYANIPHNRERFFLVAINDMDVFNKFQFPAKIELTKSVLDYIDSGKVDDKYYYTPKSAIYSRIAGEITKKDTVYQWRRKYVRENKSKQCPTLTANMGTGGHNVPIVLTEHGIRKLTPEECFNFQGFSDIILPEQLANCHLYKQAGNSVSIPIIERIATAIIAALK